MWTFRGDAHKLYLKFRQKISQGKDLKDVKEIKEITEIKSFYEQLEKSELVKIKYRMNKERNGSGILPLMVSSLPWLLFIFSKQLQNVLLDKDSYIPIVLFILSYTFLITISIIIHFREKAWSTLHIDIIEDVLNDE